jgi:hypothetical protein
MLKVNIIASTVRIRATVWKCYITRDTKLVTTNLKSAVTFCMHNATLNNDDRFHFSTQAALPFHRQHSSNSLPSRTCPVL